MAKDSKKKSVDNEARRRPEDPYDILEVIEMAETIAGHVQGVRSSDMTRHGVNTTEARATRDSQDSEEPGHFAMNYPHREEHIRTRKIKISGSKITHRTTCT